MLLEVCVDRHESALAAQMGRADRIEVCGELAVGGITPSYGLVERCVALDGIGVVMMIRPHGGGFHYARDEVDTMLRDIAVAKSLGVSGVVFGALRTDGAIDRDVTARLVDAARPLSITFHRAFDHVPNPLAAADQLMELGIDRLLTSGQETSALAGAKLIRQLVEHCGSRLTIIAGGGVNPENIHAVALATGAIEFHGSASEPVDHSPDRLGIVHAGRITRAPLVAEMVRRLRDVR